MKPNILKALPLVLLMASAPVINAQNNVSINTTGNSNRQGAILDLSNNNTAGTLGFLPPYAHLISAATLTTPITGGVAGNLGGLLIYNTNGAAVSIGMHGVGLYWWYDDPISTANNKWIKAGYGISGSGTSNYLAVWLTATTLGTGVTQDNGTGVGISASAITPASLLDVDGNVTIGSGASYAGNTAAPANGMIVQGQVGMGNNAPNAKAILDLTNTTLVTAANLGKGFQLPTANSAQITALGVNATNNGLVIFNTTLDCPEVVINGSWESMSGNLHGSVSFNPASSVQVWEVPMCVTSITITADGADGGTAIGTGGFGAAVTATVAVTSLENLSIVTGIQGLEGAGLFGAGGGGGTFVWNASATTTPIIVAGGGGGGGGTAVNGSNGSLGDTANNPANVGTGAVLGHGGKGGTQATNACNAGGGGGWLGNGTPTNANDSCGQGGKGLASGFNGGNGATGAWSGDFGGAGGFGGGGGGGADPNSGLWGAGGGGGGYTGGGGGNGHNGNDNNEHPGGGGGSSVGSLSPLLAVPAGTVTNSVSQGDGAVTITW